MRTLKSAMLGCALVLPIAFGATMARAADIVDTAVAAGSFKTLVAAVKAAGLVDTLKGKGPFTVFAPTDEAFAKLPPGTVESLLKPENKAKLQAVLTYHVVPAKVMAADVKPGGRRVGPRCWKRTRKRSHLRTGSAICWTPSRCAATAPPSPSCFAISRRA